MDAIKRISEFFGKTSPQPELRKKTSSFKPVTRLEMIRHKNNAYPASTESKFIFAANLDGSGFQRRCFPLCPSELPLDQMVQQVNRVCYRQWERSRNYYTVHPFACLDRFSNISFVLAAALSVILLTMIVYGNANSLNNALFVFACFLASSLAACLLVYFTVAPSYNADSHMVRAIRQQLSEFNRQETSSGSPRFVWTAHQDCLWIAMRLVAPQSAQSSSPHSEAEERQ